MGKCIDEHVGVEQYRPARQRGTETRQERAVAVADLLGKATPALWHSGGSDIELGEQRRVQVRQHAQVAGEPRPEIVLRRQGGEGGLDHHRG